MSASPVLDVSRFFCIRRYDIRRSSLLLVSGKGLEHSDRLALLLPAVSRIALDTQFQSSGIFAKRCGEKDSIAYDFYFDRERTLSVRALALYAFSDDEPIDAELDLYNGATAWRTIVEDS